MGLNWERISRKWSKSSMKEEGLLKVAKKMLNYFELMKHGLLCENYVCWGTYEQF